MESSAASMIISPQLRDSSLRDSKCYSLKELYRYRIGLSEGSMSGYNEQVKQALSLTNASIPEITQARVQEIIKMYTFSA